VLCTGSGRLAGGWRRWQAAEEQVQPSCRLVYVFEQPLYLRPRCVLSVVAGPSPPVASLSRQNSESVGSCQGGNSSQRVEKRRCVDFIKECARVWVYVVVIGWSVCCRWMGVV